MIKSFKCKETLRIYETQISGKIPLEIQRTALRKLWLIDAAETINDIRNPPSNHLEKLKGNRKGQYSIRINKKWRICFNWKGQNAHNVEITDYHK